MSKRIKKNDTILVLIDFQERLVPAMDDKENTLTAASNILKGFEILGLPYLVTQQYTKGLGESVAEIRNAATSFTHIEKESFSAMAEPSFVKALADSGRKNVVIGGIEAHVCVLQTGLDLLDAGYQVFLVTDAITSRKKQSKKVAINRAIQEGIVPVNVESVLFELLDNDSKSEQFRAISKTIK
ncbi:MAG: hydrolase [Clostridiales Family XIII bacterium]|jgi:nicotinamidase-related amidase|nr:hydrolase [Clostridiales Family XIII bacterium]